MGLFGKRFVSLLARWFVSLLAAEFASVLATGLVCWLEGFLAGATDHKKSMT